MIDGRGWLLSNSARHEFSASSRLGAELVWDLKPISWWLFAILLARLLFGLAASGWCARRVARATDPGHRDGRKLREEIFVTLTGAIQMAAAVWVLARHNGGCNFWSGRGAEACLAGWPHHEIDPAAHRYIAMEAAFYLQFIVKHVLHLGPRDGPAMLFHHLCTLALLFTAVALGFARIGILTLAVYSLSNPFLHLAKVANQLELPWAAPAFGLFAAVFFGSRVLAIPPLVLRQAIFDSQRVVPAAVEEYRPLWIGICIALLVLYALQLVWWRAIMRVLQRARTQGMAAASALSQQVDPSKRFGKGVAAAAAAAAAAQPADGAPSGPGSNDGGGSGSPRKSVWDSASSTPAPLKLLKAE